MKIKNNYQLILTLLLLFFSYLSNGQITKGNWLVGGNINFSSLSAESEAGTKGTTSFAIQIAPDVGYFIANNFAAGLKITFGKQGYKATGTSIYSTYTDADFGPFIRYYFLPVDKQLNILLEGSYQHGFTKGDYNRVSKNTFSFDIGPVVYFNTSVGLEFLIGYSTCKYVGFSGNNNTIQAGLGLHVHLEKDK